MPNRKSPSTKYLSTLFSQQQQKDTMFFRSPFLQTRNKRGDKAQKHPNVVQSEAKRHQVLRKKELRGTTFFESFPRLSNQ